MKAIKDYDVSKVTSEQLIKDFSITADWYEKSKFTKEQVEKLNEDIVAESLRRGDITFNADSMKPTSLNLIRQSLTNIIKSGLYLTPPHGEMIFNGEKTAIAKSRKFEKLLKFNILVSKDKAYGFIRFRKPESLTYEEFIKHKNRHKISEEDAHKWWPKLCQKGQGFIISEIRDFIPFEEPFNVEQPTGAQVFIEKVEFISKPYPEEHACRLRNPDAFKEGSFRRIDRKHDGKEYSVIMGRLKGETTLTEQAYRYDKEKWTASEGRSHCGEHDGKFEAAVEEEKTTKLTKAEEESLSEQFYEFESKIRRALSPTWDDVPRGDPWLVDTFEDYVIAKLAGKMYNLPYVVKDDIVAFNWDEAIEVERKTIYEAVKKEREGTEKSWVVPVIKSDEEYTVYGIVLEPEIEDGQGEKESEEEIKKAFENFYLGNPRYGIQHQTLIPASYAKSLERYLAPVDFKIKSQLVHKGSWVEKWKIVDMDIWKQVKEEKFTGFSISGFANKKEE